MSYKVEYKITLTISNFLSPLAKLFLGVMCLQNIILCLNILKKNEEQIVLSLFLS